LDNFDKKFYLKDLRMNFFFPSKKLILHNGFKNTHTQTRREREKIKEEGLCKLRKLIEEYSV